MDKPTNLNLEEIKGLMERATPLLPITTKDGRDYAEAFGPQFQAMTMTPDAFEALNLLLPAIPTLIEQYERALDDVRIWKREAEERSERMVELNLDRAAQGVTIMQLREALEPFARFIDQFERKPMRLDDEFYGIHIGTEFEASLRLSDLRRARSALTQQEETNGYRS